MYTQLSALSPDLVEKRNSSLLPSNPGFRGETTHWGIHIFSESLKHRTGADGVGTKKDGGALL